MKNKSYLVLAATLAMSTAGGHAAEDFIRQSQLDTKFVQDVYVASSQGGNLQAPLQLDELGAKFQLWAENNKSGEPPLLLDEELVTSYGLSGAITIVSQDPYDGRLHGVYRTRADAKYYYSVEGQNFLVSADAPEYTKQLVFTHDVTTYPPGTHNPVEGDGHTSSESFTLDGDNSKIERVLNTAIPGNDPLKKEGEEVFTMRTLPGDLAATTLDQVRIMVYPVGTATIEGLVQGEKILHTPPEIRVKLENVYPWSETWARIYPGDFNPDNENGRFIEPMYLANWNSDPAADPLDTTLSLSDWGALLPKDGKYTIEVLTQTPFNNGKPEILTHLTFDVDRTVEVNGQIFTSE